MHETEQTRGVRHVSHAVVFRLGNAECCDGSGAGILSTLSIINSTYKIARLYVVCLSPPVVLGGRGVSQW